VFCHDVEFVDPREVVIAVRTLRELRNAGAIRYVGISGYPVDVLASLAQRIKDETGEPLDGVMSYAHYTLQNTTLLTKALAKLVDAGVDCVLNGSPLGMGLLRSQGVPVGDMGDFHPAPRMLRDRCSMASQLFESFGEAGERLETLALRFAIEGWSKDGSPAGTAVRPLLGVDGLLRPVNFARPRMGVSVAGVSFMNELDELLAIWRDTVRGLEREFMYQGVIDVLDQWRDYSWPSPGEGFVASKSRLEPKGVSHL